MLAPQGEIAKCLVSYPDTSYRVLLVRLKDKGKECVQVNFLQIYMYLTNKIELFRFLGRLSRDKWLRAKSTQIRKEASHAQSFFRPAISS